MEGLDKLPTVEALAARQTASDHVAHVLREAILTGVLAEGDELNQVALAEHFGVSRVPVREALRQLAAEGLVGQEAHRRALVTTVSRERLQEMFDLRVLLETYMVRRAAGQLTSEQLQDIRGITDQMDGLADHDEWLRLNRRFHSAIYAASGATYTEQLIEQISARTTRYLWASSGGTGVDRVEEAHAEHLAILDAIEAGDAEAAARTLEAHIEGTRARIDRLLDQRDARVADGHEATERAPVGA